LPGNALLGQKAAMAAPLLYLENIRLTFGGSPLIAGASLQVEAGDRIALVGRNGSGKSTLLKIAAGMIEADSGERYCHPGATLRYLSQEPDLSGCPSALAYVQAGLGPADDPHAATRALADLGLSGTENPATMSGGEIRRAALARVLAPEPDILFLDEPTNHLDLPAIEWLEAALSRSRSAIVIVSHDRRFLANLTRKTVWLDRGEARTLPKGFSAFEAWRDDVLEAEEEARHKLGRKIVREEHWIAYGVTGRRRRNVRRLKELAELKRARATARRTPESLALAASEAAASGKLVAELKGVSFAFGSRPVVRNLSLLVARGDRLGIVGPNGAGKTTLVSLLTGRLAPDAGTVRLGANLQTLVIDQKRETLDPAATLRDTLTGGRGDTIEVGGVKRHVVGYMKDFLFAPEQAGTPVGALSGGEQARLLLARGLAQPANLLVLDEPTNDLDAETLDVLQEYLAGYAGTLLLVSHDRDFLDRVCTGLVATHGDGIWREYAGGWSDMTAQRQGEAETPPRDRAPPPAPRPGSQRAAAAPRPARLSYKQKFALETLPGEIAALEARIAALKGELDDPQLFARDRARFDRVAAEIAACSEQLSAREEQWLELEILREAAET
jgi:ATP-binding cassette subfamily F protein uup